MDTAFVYSILLKSCYKILFNTKTAMCSDTKPLLAYVKSELFFADNCCHSEIKLFILFVASQCDGINKLAFKLLK